MAFLPAHPGGRGTLWAAILPDWQCALHSLWDATYNVLATWSLHFTLFLVMFMLWLFGLWAAEAPRPGHYWLHILGWHLTLHIIFVAVRHCTSLGLFLLSAISTFKHGAMTAFCEFCGLSGTHLCPTC